MSRAEPADNTLVDYSRLNLPTACPSSYDLVYVQTGLRNRAKDTQEDMNRDGILSGLARSQALFAETLARTTVSVEKRMSTKLAEVSIQNSTQFSDWKPQVIEDAVQHLDSPFRRVGEASSNRAKVFHEISKTKFELYRLLRRM